MKNFQHIGEYNHKKSRRKTTLMAASSGLSYSYEWQYAYSIMCIATLSAMGIHIGFITSCRHINTLHA